MRGNRHVRPVPLSSLSRTERGWHAGEVGARRRTRDAQQQRDKHCRHFSAHAVRMPGTRRPWERLKTRVRGPQVINERRLSPAGPSRSSAAALARSLRRHRAHGGDKVAMLEILDEFEVRREAMRRPNQLFRRLEIEPAPERGCMRSLPPVAGFLKMNCRTRRGLAARDARARRRRSNAGFQVDVEKASRDPGPRAWNRRAPCQRLYGALSLANRCRGAGGTRAADWPGIGAEMFADLRESGLQVREQLQEWPAHMGFVIGLCAPGTRVRSLCRASARRNAKLLSLKYVVTAGVLIRSGRSRCRADQASSWVEQHELAPVSAC